MSIEIDRVHQTAINSTMGPLDQRENSRGAYASETGKHNALGVLHSFRPH